MKSHQNTKVNVCIGKEIKLSSDNFKSKSILWELSRDGFTWTKLYNKRKLYLKIKGTILNDGYLYRITTLNKYCNEVKKVFELCVDFLKINKNPENTTICLTEQITATFSASYLSNPKCSNQVTCEWEVSTDQGINWDLLILDGINIIIFMIENTCKLILQNLTSSSSNNLYRAIFKNNCREVVTNSAKLFTTNIIANYNFGWFIDDSSGVLTGPKPELVIPDHFDNDTLYVELRYLYSNFDGVDRTAKLKYILNNDPAVTIESYIGSFDGVSTYQINNLSARQTIQFEIEVIDNDTVGTFFRINSLILSCVDFAS